MHAAAMPALADPSRGICAVRKKRRRGGEGGLPGKHWAFHRVGMLSVLRCLMCAVENSAIVHLAETHEISTLMP